MRRLVHPALVAVTAVLGVLFAVFAALQCNDLDPQVYHQPSVIDAWSWVIFYGLIAALCFLSIFRPVWPVLLGLAALFCVYELVVTGPGLYKNLFQAEQFTMTGASMSPQRSEVELTREFFGAVIGLLGIAFLWWQSRKAKRQSV